MVSTSQVSRLNNMNILLISNHKVLGIYYLWMSAVMGIFGTLLSVIIRLELSSGLIVIENMNYYNLSFTLHGIIMIFYLVQPGLFGGFGNYLLPIYLAAPEVAYPRLNSLSLLLVPVSFGLVMTAIISEFGSGVGWTMYPPLSTSLMSLSPLGVDMMIIGLLLVGISSLMTSINYITTIYHIRSKGYILGILPFMVISLKLTAILLILTLPVLTGALIMLLSDLHYNSILFDPAFSGDPVYYQHMFWFFGHPEVYILIIPAFAIISQVISTTYNMTIFGCQSMVLAMVCISILGCCVWSHHLFTVGLDADTRAYFTLVTSLIAIPTGTKLFNWIMTTKGSYFPLSSSAGILAIIFLFTFTLGGTTGVMLGNGALDVALHDTYYVVAHFHFVLSLGAVIGLLSGVFLYRDSIYGNSSMSTYLEILLIGYFLFGILMTFVPMHFLGFNVMPRRISDYPDFLHSWNYIASLSSTITVISITLLFLL